MSYPASVPSIPTIEWASLHMPTELVSPVAHDFKQKKLIKLKVLRKHTEYEKFTLRKNIHHSELTNCK